MVRQTWLRIAVGRKRCLYLQSSDGVQDHCLMPRRAIGGIFGGMRIKTSVTIDEGVLRAIDKATSRGRSRSRVLEDAAREFLARRARSAREARDLEILNAKAEALNREMNDVLAYQVEL